MQLLKNGITFHSTKLHVWCDPCARSVLNYEMRKVRSLITDNLKIDFGVTFFGAGSGTFNVNQSSFNFVEVLLMGRINVCQRAVYVTFKFHTLAAKT